MVVIGLFEDGSQEQRDVVVGAMFDGVLQEEIAAPGEQGWGGGLFRDAGVDLFESLGDLWL